MKFLGQLLGIFLGLLVGAATLRALMPEARAREDRHQLLETQAFCQVLLIGPSYANMVMMDDFDAEARRIGLDKRICKLGRAGMARFELLEELDFILSQKWPKLELVLVDITLGEAPLFDEGNWFKSRTVEWHTFATMQRLVEYYRASPKRMPEPRVWIAHARHLLANYASVGRAPELVGFRQPLKNRNVRLTGNAEREAKERRDEGKRRAAKEKEDKREEKKSARAARARKKRGAPDAADTPKAEKAESRKPKAKKAESRAEEKTRWHLAKVADLVERNREHRSSPRYAPDKWVLRIRDKVRSYGHEAFFVHAPVYYHPRPPASSAGGKDPLVLLRFNDPERFPDLYLESSRGSTHHLSPSPGRAIYSRILANELLAHWKPR